MDINVGVFSKEQERGLGDADILYHSLSWRGCQGEDNEVVVIGGEDVASQAHVCGLYGNGKWMGYTRVGV